MAPAPGCAMWLCSVRGHFYLAACVSARHPFDRLAGRRHWCVRLEPVGVPPRDPQGRQLPVLHQPNLFAHRPRQPQPAQLHGIPGSPGAAVAGVARCRHDVQPRVPVDDGFDRLCRFPAGQARDWSRPGVVAGGVAVRMEPCARDTRQCALQPGGRRAFAHLSARAPARSRAPATARCRGAWSGGLLGRDHRRVLCRLLRHPLGVVHVRPRDQASAPPCSAALASCPVDTRRAALLRGRPRALHDHQRWLAVHDPRQSGGRSEPLHPDALVEPARLPPRGMGMARHDLAGRPGGAASLRSPGRGWRDGRRHAAVTGALRRQCQNRGRQVGLRNPSTGAAVLRASILSRTCYRTRTTRWCLRRCVNGCLLDRTRTSRTSRR